MTAHFGAGGVVPLLAVFLPSITLSCVIAVLAFWYASHTTVSPRRRRCCRRQVRVAAMVFCVAAALTISYYVPIFAAYAAWTP